MKYAAFTMDVECITDNPHLSKHKLDDEMLSGTERYLELLEKNNIHATLFTVCSAAEKIKPVLKACVLRGHELSLHGFRHTDVMSLSESEFKKALEDGKNYMVRELGVEPEGFRAPAFRIDKKRLKLVRESGFKYDASVKSLWKDGITRDVDFTEFALPIGKYGCFRFPVAGGSYTRLIPWKIVKHATEKYIKTHDFFVFYIHPFEISGKISPLAFKYKGLMREFLSRGIAEYPEHVQEIIDMLRENGYSFKTLGELSHSRDL